MPSQYQCTKHNLSTKMQALSQFQFSTCRLNWSIDMGDLRKFVQTLVAFLVTLFILPGILPPILLIVFLRFILIKLVCWTYPKVIGIVEARDALFLGDRFNVFKNNRPDVFITGVTVLAGKVSVGDVRKWLQKNLVEQRVDSDGSLKYPQLQQIQVKKFGYWWWEWDKDFSIDHHVRLYEEVQGWQFTTEAQLQTLVGKAGNQYTDMSRPLWEFLLVPNYVEELKDKEPKTAIIIRLSHSYWDGFSALKMIIQGISKSSTDWIPTYTMPKRSWWFQIKYYIYIVYKTPFNIWKLLQLDDRNALNPPNKEWRHEWITGTSHHIPLSSIKALKAKHGISFQGVLLSALAHALAKYQITKTGKALKGSNLNISSPFPWPDHPDRICNHWTGAFYEFPINENAVHSSLEILETGNRIAREKSQSSALVSSHWMISFGGLFPPKLTAKCSTASGATFVLSNMTGPPSQLMFCGYPILDIMFWPPLAFSGVNISVLSYRDTFKIGVMADKGILRDRKSLDDFTSLISTSIVEFSELGIESEEANNVSRSDKVEDHDHNHSG